MIRLQIVEKSGANLFSTLKRAMRSKELQTFSLAKGGRRVVHVNYPGWMNWSATPGAITCEIMNPREPGTEWRLLHAFIGRLADRYAGLVYGVSIAFPDAGGEAGPVRARARRAKGVKRRAKRVKRGRARAAKRAGRAKPKRRAGSARRTRRARRKRVTRRASPKRVRRAIRRAKLQGRARRARVAKRRSGSPVRRAARRAPRGIARRVRKPTRSRARKRRS